MKQTIKTRLPLRLYNEASRLVERIGRGSTGFVDAADELHDRARRTVGFDDFGDRTYLEGLRVLLEAYDDQPRLHPFGKMLLRRQVLAILQNRLVAQRFWKSSPGVLGVHIRRPVFILGLPGSGVTTLHGLLGQDPENQVLQHWLAIAPRPRPPEHLWRHHSNFKRAARGLRALHFLNPALKTLRPMTPDRPEECYHLLRQNFTDDTFDRDATVPAYSRWYDAQDMLASYARHRDLLKLIGASEPDRRWVLNSPLHLRNLATLFKVYPDACVVQIHRDPGKVLPAICGMTAAWREIYEDDVDPRAIASRQLELWSTGLREAMELRWQRDPAQFFDLRFQELRDDPIGTARRIYAYFHIEMQGEAQRRMRAWHDDIPRAKPGKPRFRADDFGLGHQTVSERFRPYVEHFQVEAEERG
ncbi:MAG: sulfotransferase [Candidatus Binatia bacterium]